MVSVKKTITGLIFEIMIFGAVIALISLFFRNNVLLSVLLIILWIILIKFWHKKHHLIYFVVGAVLGPLVEIICIYLGVWQYANPSFLGIPMWLPLVWGLAPMILKEIAETFVTIKHRA
jgi:hypothetical protein